MARDELGLPPPRERSGFPTCFMWGCLATCVIGVLLIGSCVAYLYHGKQALDPYVEQFFSAWNGEDYAAIERMAQTEWPEDYPIDMMIAELREARERLGKVTEKTSRAVQILSTPSGGTATMGYQVHFEHGEASVQLDFVNNGEQWLLAGVTMDTDELRPELVCPRCGHENGAGSRFCSACGMELTKQETVEI